MGTQLLRRHPSVMPRFADLSYMMYNNNFPALESALNRGFDVNTVTDEWGGSLLASATKHGFIEGLQLLLDRKVSIDLRDKCGVTALIVAATNDDGEVEALQFLLDSKDCLDFKDKYGKTALDKAQRAGNRGCAALLIAAKKDKIKQLQRERLQSALENDIIRVAQTISQSEQARLRNV